MTLPKSMKAEYKLGLTDAHKIEKKTPPVLPNNLISLKSSNVKTIDKPKNEAELHILTNESEKNKKFPPLVNPSTKIDLKNHFPFPMMMPQPAKISDNLLILAKPALINSFEEKKLDLITTIPSNSKDDRSLSGQHTLGLIENDKKPLEVRSIINSAINKSKTQFSFPSKKKPDVPHPILVEIPVYLKQIPFSEYSSRIENIQFPDVINSKLIPTFDPSYDYCNEKYFENKITINHLLRLAVKSMEYANQKFVVDNPKIQDTIQKFIKNDLDLAHSYESIKYCEVCNFKLIEYTHCNGSCCVKCLKNRIAKETNNLMIILKNTKIENEVSCNFCQSKFSPQDLRDILRDKFDLYYDVATVRLVYNTDIYKKLGGSLSAFDSIKQKAKTKMYQKCSFCKQFKLGIDFYNNTGQEIMCKDCCSYYYRLQINLESFGVNPDKLKTDLFRCMVCNEELNRLQHWGKEICGGHIHCYECLWNCKNSKACVSCHLLLNERQISRLRDYLTPKCKTCNKRKKIADLTKKSCCLAEICINCQSQSEGCLGCLITK